MIEPDQDGVCQLGTLLTEHQSLDTCMPANRLVFITIEDWEAMSDSEKDENTFYFVGR